MIISFSCSSLYFKQKSNFLKLITFQFIVWKIQWLMSLQNILIFSLFFSTVCLYVYEMWAEQYTVSCIRLAARTLRNCPTHIDVVVADSIESNTIIIRLAYEPFSQLIQLDSCSRQHIFACITKVSMKY